MSETGMSIGPDAGAGHRDDASLDQGSASGLSEPVGHSQGRVASLVAAGAVFLVAVAMLAGGGWALWMDRIERDASGFLSIGTTKLDTETYALVSELRGDGPSWLYGSTVLGDARVRATSQTQHSIFIGIGRTSDVSRYLDGTGYATIEHLESGAVTTKAGSAPSGRPAQAAIWAASTEGTGQKTLLWKPREGDWSIVLMNTDASAGVAIRGDLSAKVPLLPWLAAGLLVAGALLAAFGGWLLLRGMRAETRPSRLGGGQAPGSMSTGVPVGR